MVENWQKGKLFLNAQLAKIWSGELIDGNRWEVRCGDALEELKHLERERFSCVITSPPYYWQRDYGVEGQIGKEEKIDHYVSNVIEVMREVRRTMKSDGVLFLNLGDTYYSAKGEPRGNDKKHSARRFGLRAVDTSGLGVPRKTLIGIPWRVALGMVDDGWVLRSPIVWSRKKSLPEPSARDRPWRSYEHVFMFSKKPKYYFDRSGLEGLEDVWEISDRPKNSRGVHFAAFPDELVKRCLGIGCPKDGEVLDPFVGSGTVLRVALSTGRSAVGIDLNRDYCVHAAKSLSEV